MRCPNCNKLISNEIIKSEGARLMVNSRPDRKRLKDKQAATRAKQAADRAKIRELSEQLERLRRTKRATKAKVSK
jgi:hypothetical protein